MAAAPPNVTAAGPFVVGASAGDELALATEVVQAFIVDFFPGLGYLVLFLVLAAFVSALIVACVGFTLRMLRARSACVYLTQLALGVLLTLVGVYIAFGAVGLNFQWLFFGSSLIVAAAVSSASTFTSAFCAGVYLHALGVLDGHTSVTIAGNRGSLRAIGVFMTEFIDDATDVYAGTEIVGPKKDDTSQKKLIIARNDATHVRETELILNHQVLERGLIVEWKSGRSTTVGSLAALRPRAQDPAQYTTASGRLGNAAAAPQPTVHRQQQQQQQQHAENTPYIVDAREAFASGSGSLAGLHFRRAAQRSSSLNV